MQNVLSLKNTYRYISLSLPIMEQELSKAGRTKRFIIEQTAHIFNTKGFAGTSLNDLTNATGLTKGSIYGNFRNKDEVALAVFDYNFGRVTEYIKTRILATDHSIERLLVYPEIYRNFFRIPFLKAGCPILNTATEADDTHPELRQKVAEALRIWKQSIENQVKRGIERNEIKADVNPTEIAVVTMSLIEGAIVQAKVHNRSTELKIAMDYLKKFICQLQK